MNKIESIRTAMRERHDNYRFAHTCAVAEEALRLAALFELTEADTESLHIAALLHDCTKGLKYPEQVALADKLGVKLSTDDLASPKVLHSLTGAAVAKSEFDVSDEIADMIACHTTGKENMTLPEKLLYLADYIEPTRTFEDCVALRRYFYENTTADLHQHLDKTLIRSFDQTIKLLIDEESYIHTLTIKSRNFLLQNA